ncbi:hypothetical protein GWK08_08820 [Leptobacterium flavescens]|uniref:Uncharacterized protein n=1 Tax=Leptobacterium flavescens TaxID=472055 RepID=A0A6P0UT28_9FLAO|nr:hypothetical protein [Leptobacterium flavescens]NER13536.1 hypothetical protein [Leptobacterium flavescens]
MSRKSNELREKRRIHVMSRVDEIYNTTVDGVFMGSIWDCLQYLADEEYFCSAKHLLKIYNGKA